MILTIDKLNQIIKTTRNDVWLSTLNNHLPTYSINTVNRLAAFLAQTKVESNYTFLEENLNYSAEALLRCWPSHFNTVTANECARQPEKIANIAYANRMGNGDPASGDGWKYRGRGLIQITGKDNYSALSTFSKIDYLSNPDLVAEPDGAVLSACWFWNAHSLNSLADKNEITIMSHIINGGDNGLAERIAEYNQIFEILEN